MLGYMGLSLFILLLILYLSPFFYPGLTGILGILVAINTVVLLIMVIRDRYIAYHKEDQDDYRQY